MSVGFALAPAALFTVPIYTSVGMFPYNAVV